MKKISNREVRRCLEIFCCYKYPVNVYVKRRKCGTLSSFATGDYDACQMARMVEITTAVTAGYMAA